MIRNGRTKCVCPVCNKQFTVSNGDYKRRMRHNKVGSLFCSVACMNKYKAKPIKIRPPKRITHVTFKCKECGKEVTTTCTDYKQRMTRSKSGFLFCSAYPCAINYRQRLHHVPMQPSKAK